MAKAKFDVKTEATRAVYAGVGANDLAVEVVRDFVSTAQKSVTQIDLAPKSLRKQAVSVVSDRRKAIEARVTDMLNESTAAYGDLVSRGQSLVGRIRKQESTVATTSTAKTTVAKAKSTRTQATKTASARKASATKVTPATKKKATATKSSAKATATTASKTAANAVDAVVDAAQKVGD